MRKLLLATLVFLSACAPKTAPAPVVTAPKFPDFMRPVVPAAMVDTPAAASASRGWAFLQSGDFRTAEHEFAAALKTQPAFYPAETSLGYLELARKDAKAALPHFDRALELNPQHDDLSALLGRGQTLLALNRDADAIGAFEMALAVDPSQTELARRVEVMKFRSVEQGLARAREAARAGRLDEAAQAYSAAITSSPDSAFLYRELAGVEKQKGDSEAALEHFRKAATLDPGDAKTLTQIGEILEADGDFDEAAKAYADAAAIEPSADLEKRLEGGDGSPGAPVGKAIDQAPQIMPPTWRGADRRKAGWVAVARPPQRRRAHHRRAQQLGGDLIARPRAGVMEPYRTTPSSRER
jgi:tetratricopeptide (TPR) repeat protein